MGLTLGRLSGGPVLGAVRIIMKQTRCLGVLQGLDVSAESCGKSKHTELFLRPKARHDEQMPMTWNVGLFAAAGVEVGWREGMIGLRGLGNGQDPLYASKWPFPFFKRDIVLYLHMVRDSLAFDL